MSSFSIINTPAPGSCKGYYSPVEEACKICILSDECKEVTEERLQRDNKKDGDDSIVNTVVPDKMVTTYKRTISLVSNLFDKMKTFDDKNRTIFSQKIGKKYKKAFVVEVALDTDGIYKVLLRNAKGWPNEFELFVKNSKTVNSKITEISKIAEV